MRLPTMLMRQGNFSELLDPNNFFYGRVGRDQGPGDRKSVSRATSFRKAQLSPNGLGILNVWPFPNQATPLNGNQNWYLSANHPQHQRKDTLAVDFNLTNTPAAAIPAQQLRLLGVSTSGRQFRRNAEILRPAEPDELAEPRLDARAEQGQ